MKEFLRSTAAALGATTLYLLWLVGPLVSPTHNAVYHWSGEPSTLFAPSILLFCLAWFLLTAVLVTRRPSRMHVALWSGIVLFLPWIAQKDWASLSGPFLSQRVRLGIFDLCLFLFLAAAALWRPRYQPFFERVRGFMFTVLCFVALSGVSILCQLLWFARQARSLNAAVHPPHARPSPAAASAPMPRIIWIVLDELSYEQVYAERYPGLELPAFDRLAREATIFTQVHPAAILTEFAIPSMLTGVPVDDLHRASNGDLRSIHNAKTKTWQAFDEHQTVFEDARDAGYTTAVAGWYVPYCRILPDVLDECSWTYNAAAQTPLLWYAALSPGISRPMQFLARWRWLQRLVPRLNEVPLTGSTADTLHLSDYQMLLSATDRLLENRSDTFVLLHLPIPHPYGIYSRATGTFANHGSTYLDNLALADRFLAHVRHLLEQNGQWDCSIVLIMGDHSWRTKLLWTTTSAWTHEEQMASHDGRFDDRPAYIVKLPGQHTAVRLDTSFDATDTRILLDELIRGRIISLEALSSWISSHPPPH